MEGLAGFNPRQMGGCIDRQMDGQPDIANAFEPEPYVAGPSWTASGFCSHPWGRAGCPGAVPAIVPSLLPAPAARWLPATNCVKKKQKKQNRLSCGKAMPNQLGRGAEDWHLPGTSLPASHGHLFVVMVVLLWDGAGTARQSPGCSLGLRSLNSHFPKTLSPCLGLP